MPNITVEIFEGRTLDQRRQFVKGITQAAVDAFGITPDGVRITFFEIGKQDLARGGELFSDKAAAAAAAAPAAATNGSASSSNSTAAAVAAAPTNKG